MFEWEDELRIELTRKIEEAYLKVDNRFADTGNLGIFPWVGEQTFQIMANAAIAVLKGIEDSQEYLKNEGLLE